MTTTEPKPRNADTSFLFDAMAELAERVDHLTARLAAIEVTTSRTRDDLRERVQAFVNAHPDLRLNAIAIAESMGEDNSRVGSRLYSLAESGLIGVDARNGRQRVYFALKAPTADGGA